MAITLEYLDHIQLAIPKESEHTARHFYCDILGMREVAKPDVLADRGGLWLESGSIALHLGVEIPFRPARKAHPAFGTPDLNAMSSYLRANKIEITPAEDLPGVKRFFIADPFGNRIEILERKKEL